MFIMERLIVILRERWKYLLGYYMLGYFISLVQSGIPNLYYLIPLKPYAIVFGWGVGNGLYKSSEERKERKVARLPIYISVYHGVKYVIPAIIIMIIYCFLMVIIGGIFKFDSTPFITPLK